MLEQLKVVTVHSEGTSHYCIHYKYTGDSNWRSAWTHGEDEAKEFIATINKEGN